MANVKLVFSGTEESRSDNTSLKCYHNSQNEIFIQLERDGDYPTHICLDKETAIRFHKELKKQISYFREEGFNHG